MQQLETRSHMSWLPTEKLTTEEKETLQDYQRRKTALLDKYNTHIKDIDTAHGTWIGISQPNIRKGYKGVKSCMQLNSKR